MSESWKGSVLADRFRFESRIGSGSMAQVFRATDEWSGEPVALKILRPELSHDAEFTRAFMREAKLGLQLRHPNVVRIHDVGTRDDGTHYLVMELLEGPTLEQWLAQRGALPVEIFFDLAGQICAGLGAAHARGVIHRDLKPENVVLVRDEAGHALCKLVDFGLAKLPTPGMVSRPGAFIGTPIYISPEQAMSEPLDMRTDIYSLGILLYEMLAGAPPFDADNYGDLLSAHLHEPPPAIMARRAAARGDHGPLPDLLEPLVFKCLAKEPGERPVSPRRVAADLIAIREGNLDDVSAGSLRKSHAAITGRPPPIASQPPPHASYPPMASAPPPEVHHGASQPPPAQHAVSQPPPAQASLPPPDPWQDMQNRYASPPEEPQANPTWIVLLALSLLIAGVTIIGWALYG